MAEPDNMFFLDSRQMWVVPASRAEAAEAAEARLRALAHWLVALDELSAVERHTVTLTQIIKQARSALSGGDDG